MDVMRGLQGLQVGDARTCSMRFLLYLSILLLAIADATPAVAIAEASNITHTNVTSHSLKFNPSSCKPAISTENDWKWLSSSPTEPPDPNSLATSFNIENRTKSVSELETPVIVSRNQHLNASKEPLCIQHRSYRFHDARGWIRTRPFLITDQDRDYYIIYHTDREAMLRVWNNRAKEGPDHWSIMYENDVTGKQSGKIHMKGYAWRDAEIMVDLNVNPGGTAGEIALYSTRTYPHPHRGEPEGSDDDDDDDGDEDNDSGDEDGGGPTSDGSDDGHDSGSSAIDTEGDGNDDDDDQMDIDI